MRTPEARVKAVATSPWYADTTCGDIAEDLIEARGLLRTVVDHITDDVSTYPAHVVALQIREFLAGPT